MFEMTDQLVELRMELGDTEILARANKLDHYQRFDVVNLEGAELTPQQATALAAFAKTLGPDVVIHNGALKRVKPLEERTYTVLTNELAARERAVKVRHYKEGTCPDCGETEQKARDYKDTCGACGASLPYFPYN